MASNPIHGADSETSVNVAGVGSFPLATAGNRAQRQGPASGETPAVKSSTMKGTKCETAREVLAGEGIERRSRRGFGEPIGGPRRRTPTVQGYRGASRFYPGKSTPACMDVGNYAASEGRT